MRRVSGGDLDSLRILFGRYERRLLAYFSRLTGDRPASEDMVQEVFLRVLKFRKSFRDPGEFAPWIYTIARNVNLDRLRRGGATDQLAEGEAGIPAEGPSPAEEVERSQEAALLHRALARLSLDKREVLILSRFQDLRYEQIASVLGIEVGTVKTRVHRAIRQLRDFYTEMAEVRTP